MKKWIVIIFLILFGTIILGASLLLNREGTNITLPGALATPTPVENAPINIKDINYENVFPDPTMQKQITSSFQSPIDFKKQNNLTVISFPTSIDGRNNNVYEENNIAKYVSQEIIDDNTSLNDFIALHPNSQKFTLYDANTASAGFTWTVFPEEGIAFLANTNYGYAIRVIYFSKTTKGDFLQTEAKTFNMLEQNPYTDTQQEPAE